MTLTETTAAIAATLGLSYSVTDDAAYLLRDGVVIGVVDDRDKAIELGVRRFSIRVVEPYRQGMDAALAIYEDILDGDKIIGTACLGRVDAQPKQHRNIDIKEIKARYTVLDVWKMLMPQSAQCKDGVYHSPFRDDKTPSFSISKQGTYWKDFSSGDGGDIFDFYQAATGCTRGEAIAALASGATNQPVKQMEPPREKIIAVTDVQRGFERQAVAGFMAATRDNDSVLHRLLIAKKIPLHVAKSLWKEGSLGAIDGKPVYLNAFGCKIRHEAETSRSSRWIAGKPHGYVWRHQLLHSPHLRTVIITESETDLMRLITLVPQGLRKLCVAAPSASWMPLLDYCFLIGSHRNVVLWFDSDDAGVTAAKRLEKLFGEVSHCNVRRVSFREGDAKDIAAEREERVLEIYAEFCCG